MYRKNGWLLDGNEKHSNSHLKIFYARRALNKNWIAHLAYGVVYREDHEGKVWIWAIPWLAARYRDIALVIGQENASELKRAGRRSDFYVPFRVDSEFNLPLNEDKIRSKEGVRSDIRNVRKYRQEYEITHEDQKFRLFYDTMYVAHTLKAQGNCGALMPFDLMIKQIDSADLIPTRRGTEYVAGEVVVHERNGVRAWSLGVKDGDNRYVREGVLGAI